MENLSNILQHPSELGNDSFAEFEKSSSWYEHKATTPQTPKTPLPQQSLFTTVQPEIVPPPPEELDIRTLFTTSQLSSMREIRKVLFFDEFLIFLEQSQLYFCYYDHYQDIICIHNELIIDICIMNLQFNQLLVLKENGDVSVLFILLIDPQQQNNSQYETKIHSDEVSEMPDSPSFPVVQNLSSAFQKKNFLVPSVLQENINLNITTFGFVINPQLIFASSTANPILQLQYFSNSSIILISNQIKTNIIQLKVNENDQENEENHENNKSPSIIVDRSFDIEDAYLSHSIISSIWMSENYYHILSCNNDCVLNVTILPKEPDKALQKVQLWKKENEEMIQANTYSEKRKTMRAKNQNQHKANRPRESMIQRPQRHTMFTDNHEATKESFQKSKSKSQNKCSMMGQITSAEDLEEEEEERSSLFHQYKLKTKHKSWISSLSISPHPECEYGLSGDIDGHLILWVFEEKNYQFRPNFIDEQLKSFESSSPKHKTKHEKERDANKKHWKMLWHDKSLADNHSITMIRLEVFTPSFSVHDQRQQQQSMESNDHQSYTEPSLTSKQKRVKNYHYYAYIGTNHGKLIILQLFQKSYYLLHELFLFSSIGEISTLHIQFLEKEKPPNQPQQNYHHYNSSVLSFPQPIQSSNPTSPDQKQRSPQQFASSNIEIQQRLKVFSSQSGEAIDCLLHKHISSVIKLLPSYSKDNHDLDCFNFQDFLSDEREKTKELNRNNPNNFPMMNTGNLNNNRGNVSANPAMIMSNAQQDDNNNNFLASFENLQSLKQYVSLFQYSRFHQNHRDSNKFFSSSIKAYTVLLDKNMIITTDWVQYLYCYDLMNGQLIHTIELKSTHCCTLAAFEYSSILSTEEDEDNEMDHDDFDQEGAGRPHKKRNSVLLLSGHENGAVYLYELNFSAAPVDSTGDNDGRGDDEDDTFSVGSHHSLPLTGDQQPSGLLTKSHVSHSLSKLGDEDEEEEENAMGRRKTVPVFDLLEDSNVVERQYTIQNEDPNNNNAGPSFFTTEQQNGLRNQASIYSSLESFPYEKDGEKGKNKNKTGKQNPLNQRNHFQQYQIESNLLLAISFVNCPLKVTHFFFSDNGNYFCSTHLDKFLFLYSTNPTVHLGTTAGNQNNNNATFQPNVSISSSLSSITHVQNITTITNTKGSSRKNSIPVVEEVNNNTNTKKKPFRDDDPSIISIIPLKRFPFEEGLKNISLLQSLSTTESDSYMNSSQFVQNKRLTSIKKEDKFLLILQYTHKIQLFNVLTCEIAGNISLQQTPVNSLLKGSYMWYYPVASSEEQVAKSSSENVLIGLSVQELNSVYSFSYGKGFDQLISALPMNTQFQGTHSYPPSLPTSPGNPSKQQGQTQHHVPSSTSWEYLLQGMNSFQVPSSSPLLSLWSMKKCALLRINFQISHNAVNVMRMKQFETNSLKSTHQSAFNEIVGVQSLKLVPWIRNHRAVIVLSNGYAVVIRF
jgi:hypothetical protein